MTAPLTSAGTWGDLWFWALCGLAFGWVIGALTFGCAPKPPVNPGPTAAEQDSTDHRRVYPRCLTQGGCVRVHKGETAAPAATCPIQHGPERECL